MSKQNRHNITDAKNRNQNSTDAINRIRTKQSKGRD